MRRIGVLSVCVVALVLLIVALERLHRMHAEPRILSIPFGQLPVLADEPPAEDIVGPFGLSEDPSVVAAASGRAADAGLPRPWYGLCARDRVKSVRDFQNVVLGNPRLLTYYRQFRWENARLVSLEAPARAYVNYQKDGVIARTEKKVSLPQGDTIVTDGQIKVRTHCCNEVVEEIEAPPPEEVVSSGLPVATPILMPEPDPPAVFVRQPMAAPPLVTRDHRYFYGPVPPSPPIPPGPPAPVPEPAVWQLMATGLGAWGFRGWILRRRK